MTDDYAPCCRREIHDWSDADAGRCEECMCMDIRALEKVRKAAAEVADCIRRHAWDALDPTPLYEALKDAKEIDQ